MAFAHAHDSGAFQARNENPPHDAFCGAVARRLKLTSEW
jgi:hypothetical protein